MGMLSALARSKMGRALSGFRKAADLSPNWENPPSKKVTAFTCGGALDNSSLGDTSAQMTITLSAPHVSRTTVNLNTVLALACAYVELQYAIAQQAITGGPTAVSIKHCRGADGEDDHWQAALLVKSDDSERVVTISDSDGSMGIQIEPARHITNVDRDYVGIMYKHPAE